MTPIDCADNLVKLLSESFSNYAAADTRVATNGVTIRAGFLPKTSTAEEKRKQCPSIIVRPVEVTDADNGSIINLEVLFVNYDEDKSKGHLELYHMLERARQTILKNRIVNRRNRLVLPIKTVVPEEQPYPQWWGYMVLQYTIGQPQEIMN